MTNIRYVLVPRPSCRAGPCQVQVGDFECTKYKDLVNAHLPIPELNRYVAMKIFLVCNSVEGIVLQEHGMFWFG